MQDKQFWEKQEATRIEAAIAERKNAEAVQERLKRMQPDREIFWQKLKGERSNQFAEKLKAFNAALDEERKRRLADRVYQRHEERRQKWHREKEEERRRIEDEIRKQKEEEERIERERRMEERRIELEKSKAIVEKQRARDEEIAKKHQEDRERQRASYNNEKDSWRDRRGGDAPAAAPSAAASQEPKQESDWRATGPREPKGEDAPKKEGIFQPRFRDIRSSAPAGRAGGEDQDTNKWRRGGERQDDEGKDDRDGPRRMGGDRPMRHDGRDDRGPMRDDRGPIRRGDRPPLRDGERGGGMRRDGGDRQNFGGNRDRRDDRGGLRRDDRGGDTWRSAAPRGDQGSSWRNLPRQEPAKPKDDRREERPKEARNTGPDEDGWTDVKHHR